MHVLLMLCGCVQLGMRSAECVLFCQPSVTHESGMAGALHESVIWGQGVSEMAVSMGLNTMTPAHPRGAPRYFNGEVHDPFPI